MCLFDERAICDYCSREELFALMAEERAFALMAEERTCYSRGITFLIHCSTKEHSHTSQL